MRILIADDDPIIIDTLETLLSHLGHEAVAAHDGTQAWDLLQKPGAPSLAILDWMMPGVDGVEICRRVRQRAKSPYQYLIMLTAKDEVHDVVHGLESGADDYLRKPFDERELRARLHAGERIMVLQEELRARATFDGLTGLLNRDTIVERLQREFALAAREGVSLSIILADLDNFKHINDTHGHAVGDEVLREGSRRMAERMRSYDELGRYGGEEFLAVLPGCALSSAVEVAERTREAVSSRPIDTCAGTVYLTVSLGVAAVDAALTVDVNALLAAADKACTRPKTAGATASRSLGRTVLRCWLPAALTQ